MGDNVTVTAVSSDRDLEEFISLPWRIYADDPAWVPPLRREVRAFVDRDHHPFYRHGAAQTFLARRGGEVVGRILVSDDPNYNERHGTNLGAFGLFESIDDATVAHALLDAAASWLRERGRAAMLGPMEYSTNYTCGLLIDGFDTPPRLLMNHNPPYYRALLGGVRAAASQGAVRLVDRPGSGPPSVGGPRGPHRRPRRDAAFHPQARAGPRDREGQAHLQRGLV